MVDIILKLSEIYEKIENAISKSSTPGLVKNNGDIDTNNYIHTAGTNLTKNGNEINHSSSGVSGTTTTALKSIKYDAQGHITGVADPPQASINSIGIVQLGTDETMAAQGNHTHSSYISTNNDSVQTSHIKNGNVTLNKLNSDVYDTTVGGTSGSSKLITSNAVYQGLAKRLPTTGNGTTTGTITAAGFKVNNQTGFLKADGTVDGTINLNELNDDVYDTTVGGTSGSSKLITSNAVYQGLAKRLPTTGNGTTTGTITAAGFKVNNQTGFLKADGTVDTNFYLRTNENNMITDDLLIDSQLYITQDCTASSFIVRFATDNDILLGSGDTIKVSNLPYAKTKHPHLQWEQIPIVYLNKDGEERPSATDVYGLKIKGLINRQIGLAQIRIDGKISTNDIVVNSSEPQLAYFSDGQDLILECYPSESQSVYGDIHPSGNLKMRVTSQGVYLVDNTSQSSTLKNISVHGTVMYVVDNTLHEFLFDDDE